MSRIRKLAVAAGTFSLALGVGFVMQNGDVLASRFGAEPVAKPHATAPVPVAHRGSAVMRDALPMPQEPVSAVALHVPEPASGGEDSSAAIAPPAEAAPQPVLVDAAADAEAEPMLAALTVEPEPITEPEGPAPQVVVDENCRSVMTAEALSAGLVGLHLSSPCAPSARVSFLHQGMMFSEMTDESGKIELTVPALDARAMFLADVTGAPGAVALVEVPEVAALDRAVLQWQGAPGLMLRALEFGADYGSAGDVWAGAPQDPGVSGSGFVIELGDPVLDGAQLAQVYTFPHEGNMRTGDVALSVEVEVTADNCGREVAAQSLQIGPGTDITAHDLTLQVPGCEVEGDLLVVSGMLQDLRLAAN